MQNTEAMERPLLWPIWLVPLAPRVLLGPTTGQASCQVRESWTRDMSLPQWLLRTFQGLWGAWACFVLGLMAGQGLKLNLHSKKTLRLLFLKLASEVEPRAWKQFVSQEHGTNGRPALVIRAWGLWWERIWPL